MKRIALIPNLQKERATQATLDLLGLLKEHGTEVILPEAEARELGRADLGRPMAVLAEEAEAAVVLGGDGTLLHAAKPLARTGRPLLGINLGHLGFLSEVEVGEAPEALERLLRGDYSVEHRMMLEAAIVRHGRLEERYDALNDVVINRGTLARIITLEALAGDERIERYRGDGLVIATPTGSTAYSLAAGGPILSPQVEAILLTPICPHSLYARSLVLRPDSQLRIRLQASSEEAAVTVDGQAGVGLATGDEVRIRRSELVTKLVRLRPPGFFRVVHTRLSHLGPL